MFFSFQSYLDSAALCMEHDMWTYDVLYKTSESIAKNVGERCLVFLLCSNDPAAIAGYIGFINHGIVPVMIDSNLDTVLLDGLIEAYKPSYFWCPAHLQDKISDSFAVYQCDDYVLLENEEQTIHTLNDNLALLMTTSGSTGSPKLVRLSYDNIHSNTESIIQYLNIDNSERAITNLPMHYVYGLSIINTHLKMGASLVVTDKSMFDRVFWQLVKEKEVTSFGGVPYTYEMLQRLRFFRMELPALRYMTQAGGKLSPELHRQFAEFAASKGKKFIVMYGAAEATSRMGYLPPENSLEKVGRMGIAIPGGRFEIFDDEGNIIQEAEVTGELVYYGDNVMMGYAESLNDLCKGDEYNGSYKTGDIAKVDNDGYYTIVGRKKRFLKMFGKRTNLQEVELILKQQFEGVDIACTGKDDHMYVFVTNNEIVPSVIPFASSKLGINQSAFSVVFIDEIPKNVAGKILYSQLEQYYEL